MGAWIEITPHVAIGSRTSVAPLVGAWIEIYRLEILAIWSAPVAPLVGAWIEISGSLKGGRGRLSRSPCGSVD